VLALPHKELILNGKLLALDPSCISTSSLPGWAEFEGGVLKDAGVIDGVPPTAALHLRLKHIHDIITQEFDADVCVMEAITSGGKKNMDSTLKAVGSMIGAVNTDIIIQISPLAWQSWCRQNNYDWVKDDHKDAEALGRCLLGLVDI
jgi:hypothetical protein